MGLVVFENRVVVAAPKLDRHLAGDGARDPALGGLAQHHRLRVEPAPLIEQAAEPPAVLAVLLDRVFVVNARDEPFVGNEQQRQARRLVDAAALGFDDPVLDLIAHPEAMSAADAVGFEQHLDRIAKRHAVERDRLALLEANRDVLALDGHVVAPERDAHDRLDDHDAFVEVLEVLGFVRGAQDVRVGRVRLLDAHLVGEARPLHVLRHLLAAAEFVDERLVEPRLVDLQVRIGEQAVPIEPLDVVALERAAVAPDVHVVFLHGDDQERAGDGAAERRRVEVRHAGGA